MSDAADTRLPLPLLQGERCLLRALMRADAPCVQRHADNPRVARNMFDGFPSPYTLAAAQDWCSHDAHAPAAGYVWGIAVAGEVVGCIGLRPEQGWLRCNAELGYWIGEDHWRRGLAGDAVRQVIAWAFAVDSGITRIYAGVFAANEASQAVVRRCGFVREGILKQSAIKDGRTVDRVLWAAYRPVHEVRPANIELALATSVDNAMERA